MNRSGFVVLAILASAALQAQDTTFKTLPVVTITSSSKVSKEVARSFDAYFPNVSQAQWVKMDQNYLVKFMTKDQTNRALFDKYGSLIYHIRYGNESNLPDDIRYQVKSRYKDYNITSVLFVNQEDRNVWVINVENSKNLVILRSEEGQVDKVDSYNKM